MNIESYLDSLPLDITILNISYKNLLVLPDLSRFKKLEVLNCSENKLTILPDLSYLKKLKNISV